MTSLQTGLGDDVTVRRLGQFSQDQRAAVEARVLDERSYADIAAQLGTSEAVVRMRVSRGLASLRARMRSSR